MEQAKTTPAFTNVPVDANFMVKILPKPKFTHLLVVPHSKPSKAAKLNLILVLLWAPLLDI